MSLSLLFDLGPHWNNNPRVTQWNAVLAQVKLFLETGLTAAPNVICRIGVDYGYVNGQQMGGGALGQSMYYVTQPSYSTLRGLLQGLPNKTSLQQSAYMSNYPATDIFGGSEGLYCTSGGARANGLYTPDGTAIGDGWFGISDHHGFDDTHIYGEACDPGVYSLFGVKMHEITEVLNRVLAAGPTTYYPLDHWTYTSPGVRLFAPTGLRYLSHDNGVTNISAYNNASNGDYGDFGSLGDCFDAFGTAGLAPSRSTTLPLSQRGWQNMNLASWDLTPLGRQWAGLSAPTVTGSLSGSCHA
jgi:hypothetical protein